ncbi:MAG TPA: hypothetical protein VJI66_02785 [Candidatus Paceibacterota bacterium]
MNLIFKLGIFPLLFFTFAVITHAQIPTSIDGVTIDTSVSNPRPGQSIEVSLESFSIDLNSASVVWLVAGKTQEQGIGLKSINVVAPKSGPGLTITAVIKPSGAGEIRKTITIKTGSVDIIWEAHGYSPPFFRGKLPYMYQNSIRLIAMPHLSRDGVSELDPKTLVYSWKKGGKYIENGQGYGKQSVEIPAEDIPKPLEITVEVYNREQTEKTEGAITLEPTEPSLSFYEEDALYGILWNKALTGRVSLKNSEMKILAVPYGFNINNNTYAWSINSIEQPDLIRNRSITIRAKEDTEGSSDIELDIRNQSSILQGARDEFSVFFNKKAE